VLKSGQNFHSGSPIVLQNFKNWLETVMVNKEKFEKSDLEMPFLPKSWWIDGIFYEN
jgi:hypothetical protein